MRYFSLLDFQYWVLAVFLGLVVLLLICLAWGGYRKRRVQKSDEEIQEREGHEFGVGHDLEKNPIAPLLIIVYLGLVIWVIAYLIVIGIFGGTI
jgi:hypothetical protein